MFMFFKFYNIHFPQQQVQDLERRALIQSMVLNTDLAREITQQRIIHMQHVAKDYLQDATNELTILDVADVVTFLKIFKDMYNNLRIAKEKQHNEIHEKVSIDTPEQLPRTESGKVCFIEANVIFGYFAAHFSGVF